MTREELSESLKEFRKTNGWSINGIAKRTKLTPTQIYSIEKGSKNFTIDSFLLYITDIGYKFN